MSAVAWRDWPEAFQEAGKLNSSDPAGDQRLTFTLDAAAYTKALRSLDNEHGWLPKTDPRYQQACFTGRLEWWDERGRCVVLIRQGGQWDRMGRIAVGGMPLGGPVEPPAVVPDFSTGLAAVETHAYKPPADETRPAAELAASINAGGEAKAAVLAPGLVSVETKSAPSIVAAVKSVLPKGKKK